MRVSWFGDAACALHCLSFLGVGVREWVSASIQGSMHESVQQLSRLTLGSGYCWAFWGQRPPLVHTVPRSSRSGWANVNSGDFSTCWFLLHIKMMKWAPVFGVLAHVGWKFRSSASFFHNKPNIQFRWCYLMLMLVSKALLNKSLRWLRYRSCFALAWWSQAMLNWMMVGVSMVKKEHQS